jgi:phosphoesterase RecJ-like protein
MNYEKLSPEEFADRLISIENPLVVMHARPDGDTCGTAMAMTDLLEQLGKRVGLACPHPIPERLAFIFGERKLVEYREGMSPVAVDVASPGQLGELKDTIPRFTLMLDHHSTGEPFAPNYIVPDCSSASEALYDIVEVLIKRGLVTLTPTLARHLYTAISSDTGCFCYSNATPRTHLIAAKLIEVGVDAADINHRLFHSKSLPQIKAESFVAGKMLLAAGGKISYATVSKAERQELGLEFSIFETAIDVVRGVFGAEIAFIIKESDEGEYRASIRSLKIPVSGVAKEFGGGGHLLAAGCTFNAESIDEACCLLLSALEKLF